MRLLKKEYSKIAEVLEKHGKSNQYLLVKKKGWVLIKIEESTFDFHRKTTSELIDGNFEQRSRYFIRINGPAISVEDFESVLEALSKWIATEDQKS